MRKIFAVLGKAAASNIHDEIDKIGLGREGVLLEIANTYIHTYILYTVSMIYCCIAMCSKF